METKLEGSYYNKVITEIVKPVVVDVSAEDYEAETFKLNGQITEEQRAFVVAHHEPVTLKVLPFYSNDPVTWNFPEGPFPMPLRKIYNDVGNSATTIQIG